MKCTHAVSQVGHGGHNHDQTSCNAFPTLQLQQVPISHGGRSLLFFLSFFSQFLDSFSFLNFIKFSYVLGGNFSDIPARSVVFQVAIDQLTSGYGRH